MLEHDDLIALAGKLNEGLQIEYKNTGNGSIFLRVNCTDDELETLRNLVPDQEHGGLPTANHIINKALSERSAV